LVPFFVTGWAYCKRHKIDKLILPTPVRRMISSKSGTYMGFVPLSERRRIDLDDSPLDERVGSDQLVVRGVVHL
jgi:hypothetical protein